MTDRSEQFQFAGRGALRLSSPSTRYAALLMDFALVCLAGTVVYNYYHNTRLWPTELPLSYQLLLVSAGALLGFFIDTLYRSWRLQNLLHLLRVLLIEVIWKLFCALLG